MFVHKKLQTSVLTSLLTMTLMSGAHASGTLTGDIGVTLTIGEGCTVSNGSVTDGTNEWGTLDFGTYSDLTNVIDGSVTGSDGSNTVTVTCSEGLSPTLTLDSGLYGNGSLRNVSSDGGTTLIPYRLYSDSGRSTEIALNSSISLTADGTAQDVPIYGRVLPADQTTTAPAAGTYTDTVVATLAW